MTDTHTHIYFADDYPGEITEVVNRAIDSGVSHFVLPNVDASTISQIRELHSSFPDITTMAIGLHPTEVKEEPEKDLLLMERELATGDYKAIGEVGMDLYWDKTFLENQKKVFGHQIKMAQEAGLPVIIHCRDALPETLEVIEKVKPTVPLIFHSFTGSTDDVRKIREICNPYFGINGVVTYKSAAALREALAEISLQRMLLETDSPYLTPVPHRGKRNESSYLGHIRDKIAETLEVTPSEVEEATDRNAIEVFNL